VRLAGFTGIRERTRAIIFKRAERAERTERAERVTVYVRTQSIFSSFAHAKYLNEKKIA
jgi:hypothetical protein